MLAAAAPVQHNRHKADSELLVVHQAEVHELVCLHSPNSQLAVRPVSCETSLQPLW